jgi:hypothetical protein
MSVRRRSKEDRRNDKKKIRTDELDFRDGGLCQVQNAVQRQEEEEQGDAAAVNRLVAKTKG